nr:hypothetical protein B0A51_08142 [Rachicladosporium sp. CCFEE 5018]
MGRLLLSQSQVSVLITTVIISLITLALFLSGYTLQQHTIANLRTFLRPLHPTSQHPTFSQSPSAEGAPDWTRLAHLQHPRTHFEVCSSIQIFADLHRLRSPARRILVFPRSWAREGKGGDFELEISRRVMRRGARRFGVELRPVEDEDDGAWMEDLEKVMMLRSPGIVVDAASLDEVLAYGDLENGTASIAEGAGVVADDLTLVSRSAASENASAALPNTLVRSIGGLHDFSKGSFNGTAWLEDTAYIRFSDPLLPGPEYDAPWSMKFAARPRNKDADWTWTKLYGDFAQRRLEVCGLELEEWRE